MSRDTVPLMSWLLRACLATSSWQDLVVPSHVTVQLQHGSGVDGYSRQCDKADQPE
jgi:predicted phage-related endonuclease